MLDKLVRRLETALLSKSDAITLLKKILAETKAQNPQLELKFDLQEK